MCAISTERKVGGVKFAMAEAAGSVPNTFFCGHCKRQLSKTKFFQHKKLYFDVSSKEWRQKRINVINVEEFTFSDGSDTGK